MGGQVSTLFHSLFLEQFTILLKPPWHSNGNKYKAPYASTFTLGMLGSIIYFLAILFPDGYWAIGAILVGRLITGLGASGRTLAYSWVATAIAPEKQRTTLTVMSMTRTLGMTLGPLLNSLVAKINTSIWNIPITPYNSPGLILVVGEGILFAATFLFLTDPPPK